MFKSSVHLISYDFDTFLRHAIKQPIKTHDQNYNLNLHLTVFHLSMVWSISCTTWAYTTMYHTTMMQYLHARCSPVNLLHILRTSFPKNTSGWLLLENFQAFKGNFSDLLKTCTNIDPLILIISVPKIFDRLNSNFSLMFWWSSLKNSSLVSFLPTEICVIYLAFDKMTALLALQHEIPFCTCIYLKRQQILVNP